MEREEEINNAAKQLCDDYVYRELSDIFKFGAKWADENRHEGWIDITFMKPEDILIDSDKWVFTENVLVLTPEKEIRIAKRYYDYSSERWIWDISPRIGKITHWMPLPKAI